MSGGQCHLTILRRFSWPNLARMCTEVVEARLLLIFSSHFTISKNLEDLPILHPRKGKTHQRDFALIIQPTIKSFLKHTSA